MSIVTVPRLLMPSPFADNLGGANIQIDAADKRVATVFVVPNSGTLDKMEFWTSSTVSINAASVVRVSFRSLVSGTGEPSGVVDQYRDILGSAFAANSWISPGLMTSDGTDTGAKRVVNRGDIVVCVIEYQSFTGGDDLTFIAFRGRVSAGVSGAADGFPYDLFQSGGSWDKTPATDPLSMALLYSDASYGSPISPGRPGGLRGFEATSYNSGSTPDERGNRFTVGAPVRVTGAWVAVTPAVTGSDFELVLVDTDTTTELEAVTVEGYGSATNFPDHRFITFAAKHTLSPGGVYRLTIRPTSVNALSHPAAIMNASAVLASLYNENWYATTRTGAGAWTDDQTRSHLSGLIVDGIHEGGVPGGGGGGAVSDRGFNRGMIS